MYKFKEGLFLMNSNFDIRKLPEYLNPDHNHINESRARQCKFWRKEKLDVPLLFIGGGLTQKQRDIPGYDLKQIFTDAGKMLCSEVRCACAVVNGRSDSVPSVRANMGTGILLSCLGLEQETFPDKMPWLHEHLTKKQISVLTSDDIIPRGSFARGLEMMHYFKEIMGDSLAVYVMDTQGPFDLAHLMMGDELFTELYDDPDFVHHLLSLCLDLGIKSHKWMKEAIGEPLTSLHHGNMLFSDSFGIRVCEDTTALLNDDHIREFALPYSQKLARKFGNAWVHYCGQNSALTDAILECPEFKVLNFGHIPGHEQEIDFYALMDKFARYGKVNLNWWPVFPGESAENYLLRLHKFSKMGILAPQMRMDATMKNAGFDSADKILDFWRKI